MSDPRPSVVHLTTTDMSLELLLGAQLEAFVAAGYDVIGASAPGPYAPALARRGIQHHPLAHATRTMDPRRDLLALIELTRLLRNLRPTIVHTHNPKPGLYGRVAARLAGVPLVVNTVHGLYALPTDPPAKRAVVYGLERLAATCSDAELLQNPEDAAVLQRWKVPATQVMVLGNGIDLARFGGNPPSAEQVLSARSTLGAQGPDDVIVGLVGRLVREKGLADAFAAARSLASEVPQVRFVVIGPDDPDKVGALRPAERAAAEADGVVFLGERHDLPDLYPGMDLFVLASHREGFPRAAMEAAACGVPVIATDIRGGRQVVDHGTTGLLVPVHDPAALADAIGQLATDRSRRTQMGIAARAKAELEFDERQVIERTLGTYRRLLATKGLPAPVARLQGALRPPGPARAATAADAPSLARLHAAAISDGFLSTLGHRFLTLLYRRIIDEPGSFAFVVDDGQGVAGFVATTASTRTLYRSFVRHDGLRAALAAAPNLLGSLRRVRETWRYGAGPGPHGPPCAEVLATAVAPRARGVGVGRRLMAATVAELTQRNITEATVVTATANAAARRLYEQSGFVPDGLVEVHEGIEQTVLRWQ